jgi:glycosyltransferase involved in cell wall biosynthesis
MLVGEQATDDTSVRRVTKSRLLARWRKLQKHLPIVALPKATFTFNYDVAAGIRWPAVLRQSGSADVICFHWVSEFLTAKAMQQLHAHFRRPILWTMMDQEPVTGGCHYSFGCDGYQRSCGSCPLLRRPGANDASREVYLRKQQYLVDLPITFIAPTSWVEDRVRQSSLFGGKRVERIGLPIDTRVFRPGDRRQARQQLGLPADKRVVFFGSSYLHEPRKGGRYLIEALGRLHQQLSQHCTLRAEDVLLAVAGNCGETVIDSLSLEVRYLGYLREEPTLATAYQAADVFVCASIEDAGPMMIPEAMLCGTPVVAFATGGAPDLVVTGQTGYLARLADSDDLARGIRHLLECPSPEQLSQSAAAAARQIHEPGVVAKRYMALASELSEEASSKAACRRAA